MQKDVTVNLVELKSEIDSIYILMIPLRYLFSGVPVFVVHLTGCGVLNS